jgi:hypothetical protein
MRTRLVSASASAVTAALVSLLVLVGCAPLGTSSGADALAHLSTAVDASVAKFDAEGGTETIIAGDYRTVMIYDPSAPAGQRSATANLNDNSLPIFTSEDAISIRALSAILLEPAVIGAEFSEVAGRFTIVGDQFVIEVIVEEGLVVQSAVAGVAFGSEEPQSVVTAYGLSDDIKKLFATAVFPTQ